MVLFVGFWCSDGFGLCLVGFFCLFVFGFVLVFWLAEFCLFAFFEKGRCCTIADSL